MILIFLAINYCFSEVLTLEHYVTSSCEIEKISVIPQGVPTVLKNEQSLISCIYHCHKDGLLSFFLIENNSLCFCSSEVDYSIDKNETGGIIHGIKTQKVSTTYIQEGGQKVKRVHKQPEPIDCLDLYQQGYMEDGLYVIKPDVSSSTTDVWCDMTNGGWTVIQRRQDGSEDFYRNWEEYKHGFGNRSGEYWLGLEDIYYLTSDSSSLHIYLEAFKNDNVDPVSAFAEYSTFRINDENDKFRLRVEGFNGSCGDSMSYHNDGKFSTIDSDNDIYDTNCALLFGGAWWHKACHLSSLNGLYADTEYARGINWHSCWGHYYSLKKTVMKIRRNN
ncbi:microfibril-associated glycoprotein 4-like [Ruditapes philippinarum]|uniref:microfibril-associated glycoprotein 4-like n=1 Tax=Ruditapes philippinarum TaxID=129788 RepID=UPI00295BB896|nr:microfibril-associated glycoprotein 4-like [Ruditapes philippinarum]